jgi:hypothetical protein
MPSHCLNWDVYPTFAWSDWQKPQKSEPKNWHVLAKNHTGHFPVQDRTEVHTTLTDIPCLYCTQQWSGDFCVGKRWYQHRSVPWGGQHSCSHHPAESWSSHKPPATLGSITHSDKYMPSLVFKRLKRTETSRIQTQLSTIKYIAYITQD